MSKWSITGFKGINNVKDPSQLDGPEATKYGNYGECELRRCINFDIDDGGILIKRDNAQHIFSATYDPKLTATMAGIEYSVVGRYLRFTKPFSSEYDEKRNTIEYPAPIVLIQEVETGMWVSTTEKIYFHQGRSPAMLNGFTQTAQYNFPAIMGTGEKVNARRMNLDASGFVAVFATTRGICYGTSTGQLHNLSEDVFSYAPPQRGISYIKEDNGILQYQVKFINQSEESYNQRDSKTDIELDTL